MADDERFELPTVRHLGMVVFRLAVSIFLKHAFLEKNTSSGKIAIKHTLCK